MSNNLTEDQNFNSPQTLPDSRPEPGKLPTLLPDRDSNRAHPPRIGVDARPLAYPGTGNARYLHLMIKYLQRLRPEFEWVLLSHRNLHPEYMDLLGLENVLLAVSKGGFSRLGPLWVHTRLPALLKEYNIDLFWGTLALLPAFYKKRIRIPAIVNFHDLNAFIAPETMVGWNRLQHRLLDGHSLRNASRVLCLSDNTRQDIMDVFPGLNKDNLVVVYPGCELPRVAETPAGGKVGKLGNFILSVGSLEPRKNHQTLIAAYRAAHKLSPDSLPPLVLLGRKGWGDESIYNLLKSGELEKEGVFFLDNASDEVLRWAYRSSAFLAFPSLHEGFGLPIIEALQLDKPVLLSDIRIFREIAPDAHFAPPRDVYAWRDKLLELVDLRQTNQLRPPAFDLNFWSWEARAKPLAELIDSLTGTGSDRTSPSR